MEQKSCLPDSSGGSVGVFAGVLLVILIIVVSAGLIKIAGISEAFSRRTANDLVFVGVFILRFRRGVIAGFVKLIDLILEIDRKCERINCKSTEFTGAQLLYRNIFVRIAARNRITSWW